MSLSLQQEIIDICRNYGIKDTGFYQPTYRGSGHQHLHSFCLGKHWNLQKGMYESTRTDFDHHPVPTIPTKLLQVQKQVVKIADLYAKNKQPYHPISQENADLLIVNFYQGHSGRLGMHQDKDESPLSLRNG